METFGFLLPTPDFAKSAKMGQYNGYIGVYRPIGLDDDLYREWVDAMDRIMHGGCTLDRFSGDESFRRSGIVPVTDIPNDWSKYMIFGFDTLHLGDTWDYWTLERVTEEVKNVLRQIDEAFKTINNN